MIEQILPSERSENKSIILHIEKEINRISEIKSKILEERINSLPILALFIALALNIYGLLSLQEIFLVVWISASLYFYLFYPMLPMFLFPFRYLKQNQGKSSKKEKDNSIVKWALQLKILKNKRVGFKLFMRFFILSLLPMTIGMICIFFISIVFSLYLGNKGIIPIETVNLILVQCGGIILFYIEIFFFRNRLFSFAEYIRKQKTLEWKKLIILFVLSSILLIVGTIVVFLLLIAILLPGFTLSSFINVTEFVRVKTNVWVLVTLITQIIIMQYLQSMLSIRISRNMCNDIINRLNEAKLSLLSIDNREIKHDKSKNVGETESLKEPLRILKETELYAINRRQMFGLFPTYSIGINLPGLFNIRSLEELKEVFIPDE